MTSARNRELANLVAVGVITGLATGTTYRFDVESTNRRGATTRDDLGGQHRVLTTRPKGQLGELQAYMASLGLASTAPSPDGPLARAA